MVAAKGDLQVWFVRGLRLWKKLAQCTSEVSANAKKLSRCRQWKTAPLPNGLGRPRSGISLTDSTQRKRDPRTAARPGATQSAEVVRRSLPRSHDKIGAGAPRFGCSGGRLRW